MHQTHIQYQQVLHPDKFVKSSEELQKASTELSAFASNAYHILSSDLLRYDYFLNLLGIEALNEDSRASPDLMMEIFEVRMEIEDAACEEELNSQEISVKTKYEDATEAIKDLLSESSIDQEQVKYHMQEMKYWHQVL